jgi:hypothetical protein
MKRSVATAVLLALGASPAFAQSENDQGFYLGAGAGRFNVEIDDVGDVPDTIGSFDADDTTFKVFAGWRFNPYLAVELDYLDLGNPEDEIDGRRAGADINGFAPYVIGTLPVGPVELFAKAGYLFYDVQVDVDDLTVSDDNNEDFVYGGALWLSAAWRF